MPTTDDAENWDRGPSAPNPFVDALIALIGEDGDVTATNSQAEFDWVVRVTPHERDAVPFEVMIGPDSLVVVYSPALGWWTFGSNFGDEEDGYEPAWTVVEQLVERGGVLRSKWRTSQLFDTDGRLVSGPNHNGGVRPRSKVMHVAPYRRA